MSKRDRLLPETRSAEDEMDEAGRKHGAGEISLNEYRAAVQRWLKARRADPAPYVRPPWGNGSGRLA